jgi:DNA-binding CsgD family transcriptional regulator
MQHAPLPSCTPERATVLAWTPADPVRRDSDLVQLMLRWADLEARPRAIIRADLSIVYQNAASAAFLAQRLELSQHNGCLKPFETVLEDKLRAHVANTDHRVSSWCMPRPNGIGHVLLQAQRISTNPRKPVFGVVYDRCQPECAISFFDFREAFGLTRAENEVVLLLLSGFVADRIADSLSVSLDTVRSHIRAAYQKIDVSSREELFRRLHLYRLLIN